MARTPLMAGNWKMNLDHHQATHLVQKLAWTLKDAKHDFSAVEVAVLVPFTDLRSVQTLVDADKLDIRYGAQDVSAHTEGAYTGEISPVMLAKLGVTYVGRRALRAPAVPRRGRRAREREGEVRVRAGPRARSSASARGSTSARRVDQVEHTLAQLDGALHGPAGRAGRARRHRLRARLGDRHRRGGHARGRAGGLRRDPRRLAELYDQDWPTACASCTAAP